MGALKKFWNKVKNNRLAIGVACFIAGSIVTQFIVSC
jgi:hypothetical protein